MHIILIIGPPILLTKYAKNSIKATERKGQQGWQLIPSDKPVGAYVMERI